MASAHKPGPAAMPIYGNMAANKRPAQQTMLDLWLKSKGMPRTVFARKVGCNKKMVDYWCEGRVIPTLPYAFMIEKVTKGGVSASIWLGTAVGKAQWKRLEDRISG